MDANFSLPYSTPMFWLLKYTNANNKKGGYSTIYELVHIVLSLIDSTLSLSIKLDSLCEQGSLSMSK